MRKFLMYSSITLSACLVLSLILTVRYYSTELRKVKETNDKQKIALQSANVQNEIIQELNDELQENNDQLNKRLTKLKIKHRKLKDESVRLQTSFKILKDNLDVAEKEISQLKNKKVVKKTSSNVSVKKASEAVSQAKPELSTATSSTKTLSMVATAYTAFCAGCTGITATGFSLLDNPNAKVVAVDPSVIPLGTPVHVEGYGNAIARDTGGAIKGNRIDLYVKTEGEAIQWGRKNVKVSILN